MEQPSSVHPSPIDAPAGGLPCGYEPDRLLDLAVLLFETAVGHPGPLELVGVSGDNPGTDPEPGGQLTITALTEPDPVRQLLGFSAPNEWWAVGLVSEARATHIGGVDPLDPSDPLHRSTLAGLEPAADSDPPPHFDGPAGIAPLSGSPVNGELRTFVHLVDRSGTSVGVLAGPGADPIIMGPTTEPSEGRLGDACRRILGLPTAPPPGDMTSYVIDSWLSLVTRAALDRPGLSWPAVVALHPEGATTGAGTDGRRRRPHRTAGGPPTPAALAACTARFGADLDWERFRRSCVDAGGCPFGEMTPEAAAWMDDGMFARWLMGEMAPWPLAMELLDGLLSPAAADRMWATLALCPPPPWPPRSVGSPP